MNRIFKFNILQLIAIVLIPLLAGFIIGTNKVQVAWKSFKPIISISSKNPPQAKNLDMSLFYDVLDKLNSQYYDKSKLDSKKILYGAITGALQSLDDPYTAFFPPQQNTEFKTQLAGEFSGIGAELSLSQDNRIEVVAPLDSSPAEKAGIKSGDFILKVDGKDTSGWTVAQAVDKIRGKKGTTVALTVVHEKDKTPFEVSIVRDTIVVKSVTGWVKQVSCTGTDCKEGGDASVGYIRLSQFGDKTNDEWLATVNKLSVDIAKAQNFKGIILDLRNNPGGYLSDAVFIASEFVKDGVVVSQQDGEGQVTSLSVSRKGLFTDYPIIVLVNKGSASASEIVPGALRDHGRAKVVGEKSFGKGTVQQAVDVDGGASVHISIAKWLTPNGTWVHGKGLEPDIKVELDPKTVGTSGFDNQLQRAISEITK